MAYYYIGVETDQNGLHTWTPPTYLQTYSGNQYAALGDSHYDGTWIDNDGVEYAVYEIDTLIDFPNGYNQGLFAHTNPTVVNGGPNSINPGETAWDYEGIDNWTPTFGQDQYTPNVPIYLFNNPHIDHPANVWYDITGGGGKDKVIYVNTHNAYYRFSISVTANTTYTFSLYTYSENNYDGIMISTNGNLTNSNIYLNSSASSTSGYINHCTGLGTTKTATYTPTSSGTIYVYFRTDTSTIKDYNNTGCSYGRITWVTGTTTTITLNANGGSGGTGSVTGGYGSALPSITVPTRSGLVFMGYYDTSAISGGTQYYNSTGKSVRNWDKTGSTYTLYARWLNHVTWSYNTTYHYCTPYAQVATTTTARRTSTLRMYPSCGTGTLSATVVSMYNDDTGASLPSSSIGNGQNQWTLSSDGRELTVPAGVSAANYEINVNYTSPSGSNYKGETVGASAFFNVTATYVTNYGNVYDYYMGEVASGEIYSGNIEPVDPGEGTIVSIYLVQINNFPASAFTMSTSTVDNYFDSAADFRQWVTYNNGAKRQGTITYNWSGSSTSFSSLGTTEHTEDFDVTFNTLTLTANGEGGKSAVVGYLNGGMRSANTAGSWSAVTVSYTLSPNPYQFAASGGSVTLSKADISVPSSRTRTWTSGSTESQSLYSKSFGVKTTATGISGTSDGNGNITVTATNNTSTNTRGTYVVRPLARYGSAGASPIYGNELSFTQAAGSVVYGNPVVSAYYYDNFPASALSNVTPHVEYTQESTWNGVSGSGNTNTYTYSPNDAMPSGHSMAFSSSSSTLSTGFTKGTNFATTGKVSAATRGKTTGAARSTHSLLSVVVTANGKSSSSKACTACTQVANYLVWGSVSLTVSSPATPYSMAVSGETKAITASTATQTGTYSSGSTDTFTPTISYAVKTSKTGYSLGTGSNANKVTVTNNTSTSARNGFVVTVTASGKTGTNSTYISGLNQTQTSDRTFNQAAGAIVYGTPDIEGWSYGYYASAGGEVQTPSSFSYTQTWTWNGVAGSGGTYNYDTDGAFATHSYTSTGTLPTGCTKGSNFSTMGTITWANRGTTVGDIRDASSNLKLTITANGKTSSAVTCSFCKQEANELGTTKYKNTSGTTGYNIVYNNPTVSFSSNTLSASGGSATVNCSVTNSTNWYYKYTSGSYSDLQTGEEAGTARWRITTVVPTGTTRFHEPSSGGSNLNIGGTNYTTYASGTAVTHDNMNIISNTDKVTVTAYNTGNTSKSASISSDNIVNELGTTKYKNTSGTAGYNIVYNNPTISFNSNTLSAAGGYADINCSVTNSTNWYYKYTSGSYSDLQTGEEAGTARWRITSVLPAGTTRFHEPSSGGSNLNIGGTNYMTYVTYTSVTHDSMTSLVNTDKVTVTAYNIGDTTKKASISSANIVNELGTTKYKNTSGTTGYYSQTYGKPTNVSIGSGITAGSSSASLSCTCNDTFEYYLRYTSGTYTSLQTDTHASTITWSVYSRTFIPDGGSSTTTTRFSTSGSTLSHSSMTSNVGTDRVIVRATNYNSTSKYTNSSALTVTNELGTTKYKNTSGTTGYQSQTYGTPSSVTIGSGLLASGGSATASCTCNDTFKYYLRYTSGTYTSLQTDTHASTITWSINSQTFTPDGGSASTTTRFSISGSTVSHSSMGTNVGTDTVTVKATNANSTSKTGTGSKSVTNAVESISLTVGNNPISFGSSTNATVIATYTSTATQDVSASATYSSENSTGIVSINEGTTVTGIYVDDYYLNDSSTIATIIARGGVREYLAENSQQEHCYEPNGTITYEGTTRYLWKFSSVNSTDSTEHAYIVTTTNDPLTLLNSSSEYNVNNIFEQDLIVASLYSDKSTYDNPAQMAITKVVLG